MDKEKEAKDIFYKPTIRVLTQQEIEELKIMVTDLHNLRVLSLEDALIKDYNSKGYNIKKGDLVIEEPKNKYSTPYIIQK